MNYRHASNCKIIDSAIKTLEIWARSLGNMPIASIQLLSSVPLLKPVNLTTPVAVMLRITADVMHGVTSAGPVSRKGLRSEEHTSEIQLRGPLVCRLQLEKTNVRRLKRRIALMQYR